MLSALRLMPARALARTFSSSLTNLTKVVVVGGVAGGASAAAKARRQDESAEIVMFEKGKYVSFANCGLPMYIGKVIKDRSSLFLQTPGSFWDRFRVDVRVETEVTKIDRENKAVHWIRGEESGTEDYDKLILSPGASAIMPPVPGADAPNVFTVKTVPDTDRIKAFLKGREIKNVTVIGGGFIGLESVESFHHLGAKVTVVEKMDHLLPNFDADMAWPMSEWLRHHNVDVITGDGVAEFNTEEEHGGIAESIRLESGKEIECDLVIAAIGVRPTTKLAIDAGLEIGPSGGVRVNSRQQSSGDISEVQHLVSKQPTRLALAGPANKQGRVAGANAVGGDMEFHGAIGTGAVQVMGLTAASTGLNERDCKRHGIDYEVILLHPADHATYYPGSQLIDMKLLSEKETGRILGAQLIGTQGVDKRCDVFATAIAGNMTVYDLEQLDLAYCPQIGSAKDPAMIAGYCAANSLRGLHHPITPEGLHNLLHGNEFKDMQLIDVRTYGEADVSQILGTTHTLPLDSLRELVQHLDPEEKTVVYCRSGLRGYVAECILRQHGFTDVHNLTGGILSIEGCDIDHKEYRPSSY